MAMPHGVEILDDGIVTYSTDQVTYKLESSDRSTFSESVKPSVNIFPVGMGEGPVNMMLEVYPEPNSQFLLLTTSDELREDMYFEIYDEKGTLINKEELMGIQTEIDINDLWPSSYFIRVKNGAMGEKIFKVVKR
ncbi:MAG: T9SS type A sorting domain-containing protein [Flavobacteriales bacterium]|nr:T9SS type A sorting domain-containing protein [Flavobacteriales bacterium]